MDHRVAVIDNGTGFTKMGWAGNPTPTYDIPTVIADHVDKATVQVSKTTYEQLDFFIGHEALSKNLTHNIIYPIRSGLINDWTLMEKFWHRSIFDYLRCEPEETSFILTEPPMNPPENREAIAEIMFETFNVKALNISVQAVLALYSNYYSPVNKEQQKYGLTGTVLDSGDGVTHVIPIADGYVIGSCIKHIPLAGRDITKFIAQFLKDRGEKLPIEDLNRVAGEIKEKYGYITDGDLARFSRQKDIPQYGKCDISISWYSIDVGYERFLGPEMFFHPEFLDAKYRTSIDEIIDIAIQGSPIDCRRSLYANIVLSGGSTLFDNFPQRLQSEVQKRIDTRLMNYQRISGQKPASIGVGVAANPFQRYSVWQGGSFLSAHPNFAKQCMTKDQYFERGPSIARANVVFQPGM